MGFVKGKYGSHLIKFFTVGNFSFEQDFLKQRENPIAFKFPLVALVFQCLVHRIFVCSEIFPMWVTHNIRGRRPQPQSFVQTLSRRCCISVWALVCKLIPNYQFERLTLEVGSWFDSRSTGSWLNFRFELTIRTDSCMSHGVIISHELEAENLS